MYRIAVEFIAPFRIYLQDRFFRVQLAGRFAEVKAIPLPPQTIASGVQVHGTAVEISHDLFGYAGRTKFCLIMDEEVDVCSTDWKAKIANRDNEIRDLAIVVTNRLLEVYRDRDRNNIGEDSFHVIPLVRGDLSRIRICVVDEELNEYPDFVITWPAFASFGTGIGVQRDAAVISDIENVLRSGDPIPVGRELVSSARNHLWRGVYRLVPVEANTAFESFVPMMIHRIDPTMNLCDARNIYSKLVKLEEVLSTAVTAARLIFTPWFSASARGWQGLIEPNLLAWCSDCYILRNKVIHEGYNCVTWTEAQNALEAMLAARFYIETEVNRIL